MASFNAGTTFVDGVANDVTAAKLGTLVTNATPTPGFIQDRTVESIIATNDTLLIGDASDSSNLKQMTVANFAQTLPTAKVTTGTIETGTFGTTTSTAATITTGTIPTLVATTLITTGTGTAAAPAIVPTGDTNTGILFPAADTIAATTNGTERLRIDSSGNVGIGTTSPSAPLHISGAEVTAVKITGGSSANQGSFAVFQKGSADRLFVGVASAVLGSGSTSNDSIVWTESTNNTLFYNNGTERLRITSSGSVLVGCTASPSSSVSGVLLKNPLDSASSFSLGAYTGGATVISFINGNGAVGSISVSGSATAYNTSSDYRLKTNLEPISNAIERIKQLPVYRFNWIADESGNKVDGFVAHEAQSIVPEAILGTKDEVDSDGKPIYQGIDQSKIVPLLTAALKDAIAKIETLEAKVTALEAA